MKSSWIAALLLATTLATPATWAQAPGAGGMQPIALFEDPNAIPLYSGAAPGSENDKQVEVWAQAPGDRVARNVTRPTLVPVLPAKGKATGAAVIVTPGGGNVVLSMDREGYDVAKYLAEQGIAAFVLKYRVNPTPASLGDMPPMPAPGALAPGGAPTAAGAPPAPAAGAPPGASGPSLRNPKGVADGQEALRLVRRRAKEFGVDPARVGSMGFSAGAGVVMGVTLANDPGARPDFIAPIYGPSDHVTVPANAPPMFIARAADDPLFGKAGFGIVEDWIKAGVPVEFHLYESGGHGFGYTRKGTTSDLFMQEFVAWLKARGTLGGKPAVRQ